MPAWFWRASIQAPVYRLQLKTWGSDEEGFESEAWGINPGLPMKLLHLKIFIAVWAVIMLAGFWVPDSLLEKNLYSTRVMNWLTFAWICSCFFTFWMGTFIERSLYADKKASLFIKSKIPTVTPEQLEKMLRTFTGVLYLITSIILIRVAWCVLKVGSLSETFLYAVTRPISFRFDIWQQTTIHGMGALSDTIIGLSVFACAMFGLIKKYELNKNILSDYSHDQLKYFHTKSKRLLIIALTALIVYFLISTERLVLVVGVTGSFFAYYLILQRFPLKNVTYISLFFFALWVLVEGLLRYESSGNETARFVFDYAMDRLILYLVPALRNIDTVVNYLPNHTYGWYSFGFLLAIFKLDFFSSISSSLYAFTPYTIVPGFGAIPVFGTAYADFGLAGLAYFILLGFIYQRFYRKAILEKSFLALQIYALFLVALVISFMPFLFILARFWINIVVLIAINKSMTTGVEKLFTKKTPALGS